MEYSDVQLFIPSDFLVCPAPNLVNDCRSFGGIAEQGDDDVNQLRLGEIYQCTCLQEVGDVHE
jgi:hypothetical protein